VTLAGTLSAEALAERYAGSDIFVLASRFEGYGMAFAEALVRGLPIVATATGAIPATVPPETGLLVPADDAGALASALRVALTDPVKRQQWSDAAWKASMELPTWQATGATFASALRAAE
jgi:glycosyltransferase involved in cell wall biosynthesis